MKLSKLLGIALYIEYFSLTVIIGVLLLSCMVGVICLAENKYILYTDFKKQTKFVQEKRKSLVAPYRFNKVVKLHI